MTKEMAVIMGSMAQMINHLNVEGFNNTRQTLLYDLFESLLFHNTLHRRYPANSYWPPDYIVRCFTIEKDVGFDSNTNCFDHLEIFDPFRPDDPDFVMPSVLEERAQQEGYDFGLQHALYFHFYWTEIMPTGRPLSQRQILFPGTILIFGSRGKSDDTHYCPIIEEGRFAIRDISREPVCRRLCRVVRRRSSTT